MSKLTVELMAMKNNKINRFELSGKEVKHCPFCGDNDPCVIESEDNDYDAYWVRCCGCGVEGPLGAGRKGAIARWQKRAK